MTESASETLTNLCKALDRLNDALLVLERDDGSLRSYLQDGAIQRFEFCFELTWQLLAKLHKDAGAPAAGPRPALKAAYAVGWIDDEQAWLEMLEDRNMTAHVYDEAVTTAIAGRLPGHLAAMRVLVGKVGTVGVAI